jgi:HSP20 family protein
MTLLPTIRRRPIAWLRPYRDADPFEEMNRQMSDMLWPRSMAEPLGWTPTVDMVDHNGEYVLTAEIPGMTKDDIEVDVQDDVLTLRGEKTESSEHEDKDHRLYERRYGAFERRFTLSRAVDGEAVTAEYEDGVLTVHIPKAEAAKGRKIEISAK